MKQPTAVLTFTVALALLPSSAKAATIDILGGPFYYRGQRNHEYYLISSARWGAAEAKAVEMGGHLVTINTADEAEWVYRTFERHKAGLLGQANTGKFLAWIGLSDQRREGVFRWSSGEPVTHTNWASTEPNEFYSDGTEDYVHIYGGGWAEPGTWNDHRDGQMTGIVEVVVPEPTAVMLSGIGVLGLVWRRRRHEHGQDVT